MQAVRAVLALEDGNYFEGEGFGAVGRVEGEGGFNTSLTGEQEILTDPSYAGQVGSLTYPEIGNYGVDAADVESARIQAAGLVG
jgi:carbamoyl-phosphate synthase small subunit